LGLKCLDDIERERAWPARSAEVVLQLALDWLARHSGFAAQARGVHKPLPYLVRRWRGIHCRLGYGCQRRIRFRANALDHRA
jgi:Domain of unknown function (DUF6456)